MGTCLSKVGKKSAFAAQQSGCSQRSHSFSKKLICVLSDAESANLFLLTTEATREFHVPKFGDLDRWAEPGHRCAVQNFILFL